MMLSLSFLVPTMQTQITVVLNTRLAANPHLKINMEDILNILQKILNPPNPPTNQDHLQLLKIESSKPLLFKGKQRFEGQHNTFPSTPPSPFSQTFFSVQFLPHFFPNIQATGRMEKDMAH
ncbi:hypothetical protein O181_058968 [Austropuccinia psidii MF-1]|uniref:Uncharacterized protein n=1 Tax=Austropuccinia psidii MF-1 TaxID=1389203 RepID=A0A9Q3EHX8_9BASI|nr:hypothetical protein [Austropuccinia psidii MF-1]